MSNNTIANETLPVNKLSVTIQRGKHDKENPYVMISKKMLKDVSLSPKSKGVLCYLLSLPDTWQAHPRQVAEALGVGKDQIYSVLSELLETGYAYKKEIKGEKGRFGQVLYEFYEDKLPEEERFKEKSTVSGYPDTGSPDTDIPTIENKDYNEDIPKKYKTSYKVPEEPKEAIASSVDAGVSPKSKPKREKPDFSPKVRETANQMLNLLVKYNPVYRPPTDLAKFLGHVQDIIEKDMQDVDVLIKTFEWAVADNEKRGDFNGWQGIIATNNKGGRSTTPAEIFRKHFSKIHSQMGSRPKRKFAPSSNQEQALEAMEEMNKRVL